LNFAKRKEYLSWNDDFFGFQLVVSEIENDIIRLFEDLSSNIQGIKYIVYGELFGGEYPHPDVMSNDNLNAIQTGVYYSPSIKFCAFDIAIEKSDSKYYLDYETSISYFKKHNLFYAKPLFIGKFRDAVNFDTRINSTLPKELKLPEINENLIEGVVIKPFNQTDIESISSRPIVKLKNKEFDEENRFHQAEKWSFIPNISSKSQDLSFILDELRNYITKNRLESAISKIGPLDMNNGQRLMDIEREVIQDTLLDFNENNDNLLEELSLGDKDWIYERVNSEVKELINTVNTKPNS
jgi:Rnl2 family RNA ligase